MINYDWARGRGRLLTRAIPVTLWCDLGQRSRLSLSFSPYTFTVKDFRYNSMLSLIHLSHLD